MCLWDRYTDCNSSCKKRWNCMQFWKWLLRKMLWNCQVPHVSLTRFVIYSTLLWHVVRFVYNCICDFGEMILKFKFLKNSSCPSKFWVQATSDACYIYLVYICYCCFLCLIYVLVRTKRGCGWSGITYHHFLISQTLTSSMRILLLKLLVLVINIACLSFWLINLGMLSVSLCYIFN